MWIDPDPDPVTGQRGSIYIADGYGNHRVVVFQDNGNGTATWLRQWGGVAGTVNVVDRLARPVRLRRRRPSALRRRRQRRISCTCATAPTTASRSSTRPGDLQRIIPVVPGTGVTLGIGGVPGLGTAGSAWDLDVLASTRCSR